MNSYNKQILKDLIPPIVLKIYHKITNRYGYFGNYSTWEEARKKSSGYNSDQILSKVKESLLKVKNGEAIYERDSVLFDNIRYSWPLLAGLMWIASRNRNKLNLVDFGGSLGSSYFQNIKFLSHLDELRWNIVELNDVSNNSFDFAICNVTIQMVMYPEITIKDMKRIAKYQIVSFPNFAFWRNRLDLLLHGRMPKPMLFGYTWHNTGHIHQLSIEDFEILSCKCGLQIKRVIYLGNSFPALRNLFPNLLAKIAIYKLSAHSYVV